MIVEIEWFCLGCGMVAKAEVSERHPVLETYRGVAVPAWCHRPECQVRRAMFNDTYEKTESSLYKRLLNANCVIDHHESDLYVKDTPIAELLIKRYAASPSLVTRFFSAADSSWWWDVPFAYEPFWQRGRAAGSVTQTGPSQGAAGDGYTVRGQPGPTKGE